MRGKAEKAIDEFYEGYNKVKERNIRENKWVFHFFGQLDGRIEGLGRLCMADDGWSAGASVREGPGRLAVRVVGRKLAE